MKDHLSRIKTSLREGRFISEAAVSQGVVLPTLHALGWPVFDTSIVTPEYSLEGRRVDFALCNPANRPGIFIEVKRVGLADGADRQLFEYAFHVGVQLAILTDGQEWSFYLPGEQGHYADRCVYKLNLLERNILESTQRLERYLSYASTCDGTAIQAARSDYRNIARKREIDAVIPEAWNALVREQDSLLLELLADKVEEICGYKPSLDVCADFFESSNESNLSKLNQKTLKSIENQQLYFSRYATQELKSGNPTDQLKNKQSGRVSGHDFSILGRNGSANTALEVMIQVFAELAKDDPQFLERFIARKHGKKRRYVSRNKNELYLDRPDLVESSAIEIIPGWWIGTNYSRKDMQKIINLAKEVARPEAAATIKVQLL